MSSAATSIDPADSRPLSLPLSYWSARSATSFFRLAGRRKRRPSVDRRGEGSYHERFNGDGKAGPTGSACSYVAPLRRFSLQKGLSVDYEVFLTIDHWVAG